MVRRAMFILVAAIMLAGFLPVPAAAHDPTPGNLRELDHYWVPSLYDDSFWNYDFNDHYAWESKVDWPVNMLFCYNADKWTVYNHIYWGTSSHSPMWNELRDSYPSEWKWDWDRGTRSVEPWCKVALHMRCYAANGSAMSNEGLGSYIVGTSHHDRISFWGWSETAENDLCQIARDKNYMVIEELLNFYNYERLRFDGAHCWESNGYTSVVFVGI